MSRPESRRMYGALVSQSLRPLVDGWFETGRRSDGSEAPQTRDIHRAGYACLSTLWEYLKNCPPSMVPSSDPSGFTLEIAQLCFSPWSRNFFESAEVEAKRLFLGLMVSDWRYQLCKCRCESCGQYFLLDKPRKTYRHGTFCCGQHQSLVSAAKCTRARRKLCESELIDLAAGQLRKRRIKGPEWQHDREGKRQLAAYVCNAISESRDPNLKAHRPVVRLNWITRNQRRIEQRRVHLMGAT